MSRFEIGSGNLQLHGVTVRMPFIVLQCPMKVQTKG